jgi:hypothetical protein
MGDKKRTPVNFFCSSQISLQLLTYMSDFNILKSMMYLDVWESDSIIKTDI